MTQINNPAGRLLLILEKCQSIPKHENTAEAWSKVLGVSASDRFLLIGKVGKVFSLADNISIELSKIDNVDLTRYMSWTKYLEGAFSNCDFGNTWQGFIGRINDPMLDYLHMASGMLATNRPQPVLEKSQLDTIYEGAKDLIKEIIASDLPIRLKHYFLEQLRKLCTAVEEYQITGSAEVVEIVEATFGKAILCKEMVELRESEASVSKFWSFMTNVVLVISSVSGTLQIADYTMKVFPELGAPKQIEATFTNVDKVDVEVIKKQA